MYRVFGFRLRMYILSFVEEKYYRNKNTPYIFIDEYSRRRISKIRYNGSKWCRRIVYIIPLTHEIVYNMRESMKP